MSAAARPAPSAAARDRGRASPARRCALATVRRVFDAGAYADRAFRAEADRLGLEGRERAFAQQLAHGTVQRRATLDHVLDALSSRPSAAIDPPLRDALRLGVYELVYLHGVPARASVDQAVELAKLAGGGGHRFANAVMRRAAREAAGVVAALRDDSVEGAATLHSHPEWIVRMWWHLLGPEETRRLLARDNEPPERCIRVNPLKTAPEELQAALERYGVQSHPAADPPEALILDSPFDSHDHALFRDGAYMPQSRASMAAARALRPQPGDRVLDLCAAPGAKTTHLAALMGGRGQLVAIERHEARAAALAENCRRMGASWVKVECADAADPPLSRDFDRVLLDAPCSGLGTLQLRPDARWRKAPEQVEQLARLQDRLLHAAADRLAPGGTLVYSTCTISPPENEERIEALVAARPELAVEDLGAERPDLAWAPAPRHLQYLPHRDGTEGFFIARLRRSGTLTAASG